MEDRCKAILLKYRLGIADQENTFGEKVVAEVGNNACKPELSSDGERTIHNTVLEI